MNSEMKKIRDSGKVIGLDRVPEVRTLRQELERTGALAAEASCLRERNLTLANTVEGLEAQLELKGNEERRLHAELATLSSHCKDETAKVRRLSMEKEELQYRLSLQLRHGATINSYYLKNSFHFVSLINSSLLIGFFLLQTAIERVRLKLFNIIIIITP